MRAEIRRIAAVLCLIGACPAFAAETYPNKPVQLVLSYTVGSSVDVVFRVITPKLSEQLGQQVVVVNRPGGAGTIGVGAVAKAVADGYTLGVATMSFATNRYFTRGALPYDTEKDFTPISLVTRTPLVLTVSASVPARSVKELIALAKAKPDSLNYGSGGIASSGHLAGALFGLMSGIRITHVPFTSGSASGAAGDQTQLTITGVIVSLPNIKAGRWIPLGVTTAKPVAMLPGVPTIAEAGVPGFEMSEWFGVITRSGTPPAVVGRVHGAIAKAVTDPEVRERLDNIGVQIIANRPDEFEQHIKRELATWSKVAAQINAAESAQR